MNKPSVAIASSVVVWCVAIPFRSPGWGVYRAGNYVPRKPQIVITSSVIMLSATIEIL